MVSVAARMKTFDATFSEPVFLEWASLLYVRAFEAAGSRDLEVLTPYFSAPALGLIRRRYGPQVSDVQGVVLGAIKLVSVNANANSVQLTVAFQSNSTAVSETGREQAFYVHETWTFSRARGVKSRTPALIERMGCPHCGSPVERTALDRCLHCAAAFVPGALDWSVLNINLNELEPRGPLLTGDVEEAGTDLPTVFDPALQQKLAALTQADPRFTLQSFEARAREVFLALQAGWTQQRWERLRPNETDALFQSHRFWLEEYKRQNLRNVLEAVVVKRVEIAKADSDLHYDAVTCRIHATMKDSTIDLTSNQTVAGNPKRIRDFTEYWTFIRRLGVGTKIVQDLKCPNCGAPLEVTQAGICSSCEAKLTRGEFGWVLSRIDQDEEYTG